MKPITRRSFLRRALAASTAAVASPALAAPVPAGEIDVVIVGAGAAGIAAARRIAAAGRRFVLVEASDHVGGRCVTDTRSFEVPFDRGAHTIYGPDNANPLIRLAPRGAIEIYPAPSGQKVRIGRRNAREGELEDFLATLVRANRAIGDASRRGDGAASLGLPRDLGEWRGAVEFVLGPYNTGKELNEISSVDFARMVERDTGFYCRQGFGALLTKLAEGVPVQLNTPVQSIDTGNRQNRVEVKSPRGAIAARFGIVTVSTEMLNSGNIKFESERPIRQLEAASRLKLGSCDRIALELPGNPLGLQRDDFMFEKADGNRTAALMANVGGSSLVTIDVAGKFGRDLSAQGEKAMTDFAIDWLTRLFGADIRKAVKRSAVTQWNADPWTLGAISTASPGAQTARRALAEPMRDRLFFAGEATHETLWGTVNGAWESGERAAEGVLRRLGVLKDPVEPKPAQRPQRKRS